MLQLWQLPEFIVQERVMFWIDCWVVQPVSKSEDLFKLAQRVKKKKKKWIFVEKFEMKEMQSVKNNLKQFKMNRYLHLGTTNFCHKCRWRESFNHFGWYRRNWFDWSKRNSRHQNSFIVCFIEVWKGKKKKTK